MPKVLSANLLRTGEVVYLAGDGRWVPDLSNARTFQDKKDEVFTELEAMALASVKRNDVISVYVLDVRTGDGTVQPVSVREAIRAAHSPTV